MIPPVENRSVRRPPSKVMPFLALVAGVALLLLEWREGSSFWFWFAVVLIVFAIGSLWAGRASASGRAPED